MTPPPPPHLPAEVPMDREEYDLSSPGWSNVQDNMSSGSTSGNQFQRPPSYQQLYHPQPSSSPQTMGNTYPYQQPSPVGYHEFGYQQPAYPAQTMGMLQQPLYYPNNYPQVAPPEWSGPNRGHRTNFLTEPLPSPPEYRQQRSSPLPPGQYYGVPSPQSVLPTYHPETRAPQNEYRHPSLSMPKPKMTPGPDGRVPRQSAKRKASDDMPLPPSKFSIHGLAVDTKPQAKEQEATAPLLEFPFSYLPTFSNDAIASQAPGLQSQDTKARQAQAYEPVPRTYEAFWGKAATYSSPTTSFPSSGPSQQLESQRWQSQQAQGRKGQSQIPPFQPPELPQPQHQPQKGQGQPQYTQPQGQKGRGRKLQGQGQTAQSPRLPTPQLSQSPQLPTQQTEGQLQYHQHPNRSPQLSQSPQLRPQQTQGQFQYQPPQGQGQVQSPQPPKPKRGRPPTVRFPKPAHNADQVPTTAAPYQPAYAPAYSSVYAPPVLHPHDSACCPNGVQSEFCRQGMMFRARSLTPVPPPFPELHEISDTQRFVPDGEGGWLDLADLGNNWEWKAFTDKEDLKLMLALKRAGLGEML